MRPRRNKLMRLDNRIGIVKEQPGRPELGAEVVTLRLELGRQAAIQDNRTDRKCVCKAVLTHPTYVPADLSEPG